MNVVLLSFCELLPYVFMLLVVGIIWDRVISAFRGWF